MAYSCDFDEARFAAMLVKSGQRRLADHASAILDDLVLKWNPEQPRGVDGRWIRVGSAFTEAAHAVGRAAERHDKPLSDKKFAARRRRVEQVTAGAAHLATDRVHSHEGRWTEERDRLHREIADHLYARAAQVPNEGKAIIAGGLGGAGKSTVLRDHAGIDASQYLTINPDDIKEELAHRGMVPEIPGHEDLSPMERSSLVHEESSRIAQLLADRAYRDKKNMIWDITMSSAGSVKSRLDALDRHGYTHKTGVFVDIPAEVSVKRALARYRGGVEQYHAGKGLGGRYVPPRIIRAQRTKGGKTINRGVFDQLAHRFDTQAVYDNSVDGRAPVRVA